MHANIFRRTISDTDISIKSSFLYYTKV